VKLFRRQSLVLQRLYETGIEFRIANGHGEFGRAAWSLVHAVNNRSRLQWALVMILCIIDLEAIVLYNLFRRRTSRNSSLWPLPNVEEQPHQVYHKGCRHNRHFENAIYGKELRKGEADRAPGAMGSAEMHVSYLVR